MNGDSGTLGNGRFRLVRQLGVGGMGVVYEAEDRERGGRLALKTLKNASADTLYRLKQEFRALADLQHPNLVALYELFVADDCFFTMELIQGEGFLAYVRNGVVVRPRRREDLPPSDREKERLETMRQPEPRPFDEARLRDVLAQLVRGVVALHDAGKIHRDVKPSNVLVTHEGRLVLVDFGLVTPADVGHAESRAGEVVGTVTYMAPEQCRGDEGLTPAVDWYGVGVALYEALTGRLPFDGPAMRVLVEKQQRAPPPPRAIQPTVPKDLDELCTALLEREPRDRPDGRAILRRLGADPRADDAGPRSTATRATAYAGRGPELLTLDACFAATLSTMRPSVVVLRGVSGIGKSSLVQQFFERTRVEHRDAVLLRGRCYERESVPFQAIDSLVDDLSHYLMRVPPVQAAALMPREAGVLPRLFPVLGRVAAIATAPRPREGEGPQDLRTRAFVALREMLQRIGERHPLVIALDDMHWVDASTLRALEDVLCPPDPPPLLAIFGTRPEGGAPLEGLAVRTATATTLIELSPLSREAATELAAELLGPEAPERAGDIAREASGNPFFIGELVKYVQTSEAPTIGSVRLEDVIAQRLTRLSTAGGRILELVVLSDAPITRRALASASDVTAAALTGELATLRALHFTRSAQGGGDERIEAYHARVRDVVLARVPPEEVRAHHGRLALALAQWSEGSSETLALHWHAAGDLTSAKEHALRAADDAATRSRYERAAELFQLVLDMGTRDAHERRGLQRRIGEALSFAGRPRAAAAALALSSEGADPALRLELRRRAAEELLRGGYIEEGLVEVAFVLDEIHLKLAPTPLRALVSLLLLRAWLVIRGLGFREHRESEIAPAVLTKIDVCWSVAVGLAAVDHIRGSDGQARHLRLALAAGEPTRVARALAVEASFLASTGDGRRARKLIAVCRSLATRIGSEYITAFASFAEGFVLYFCDSDWGIGVKRLDEAERIFRRQLAGGWEIDTSSFFASLCLLYSGEVGALAQRVPLLAQEAERRGDLYQGVSLRTRLNVLWLLRDEPREATRDLDEAIGAWSSPGFQVQHFYALGSRCNTALYEGRPEEAAANIGRDLRALDRSLLPRVTLVRVETWDLRARIALACASARGDGAERAREVSLARGFARRLERERTPIASALAMVVRAGAAAAAGDASRAEVELRRAVVRFEEMDTKLYAAACRRRLGEVLGGDAGRGLVSVADRWFAEQGVKNPARTMALFTPGFR